MIRLAALTLYTVAATAQMPSAQPMQDRWVYVSRNLTQDQHVEDIRQVATRASQHGLHGILLTGSFAFHPHTGNRQFSQTQSKSMGRDGEVVVGTCVMGLEPLARRALLTGDLLLISRPETGLAHLDQYRRPQGSEHWEVPLACPNLRASALATRCYLYSYQLTGKQHHLNKARFWATTGLPFLYTWQADEQPVMPYASISVMGTPVHTHG